MLTSQQFFDIISSESGHFVYQLDNQSHWEGTPSAGMLPKVTKIILIDPRVSTKDFTVDDMTTVWSK